MMSVSLIDEPVTIPCFPCIIAPVARWGLFIDCYSCESDHSVMPYVYKITYPNGKIYIGQDRTDSTNYFGSSSIMQ
jgi:hypothetical protein